MSRPPCLYSPPTGCFAPQRKQKSRRNYLPLITAVALLCASLQVSAGQEKAAGAAALAAKPATGQSKPAPKIELEPDEKAYQAAQRIADPNERVEALIKLVADYPVYPYIRNVVYTLFRDPNKTIRELQEPQKRDAAATKVMVDKFVAGTAAAPAYARAEFYYGISKNLVSSDILLDNAIELARKAIPLLSEEDYVANERRMAERKAHYTRLRDPGAHVDPFSVEEAKAHFRAFAASVNANLGNVLLQMGDLEEANQAFRDAYRIEPIMEAATGLSEISERRGNASDELKYMMDAALTGRLPAAKLRHLEELYATAHGGNTDELQKDLDAVYRERFETPLRPTRRGSATNRGNRVVLAEFITGAGCEPCTSADLAFDAELKRYSRDELALIVYHMHAPTSDPMSNASAEARFKYYDVRGAPTVFLDGEHVTPGEGMKSEAQRVFDALDQEVARRLAKPEAAHIKLAGNLENGIVKVNAVVDGVQDSGHPLRLMLALLENEVSYSGENGLRFHPMVARNVATPVASEPAGFVVEAGRRGRFQYSFALDEISTENLRYYDWYVADLYKRVGIKATFREKRYVIDPKNLSVVAFIQDQATKQVLQAAYVRVVAARTGPTASVQ